jgi:hypothetical protein
MSNDLATPGHIVAAIFGYIVFVLVVLLIIILTIAMIIYSIYQKRQAPKGGKREGTGSGSAV